MHLKIDSNHFYYSSSHLNWYEEYLVGKVTEGAKGWSEKAVKRYDEFLLNTFTIATGATFGNIGLSICLLSISAYIFMILSWILTLIIVGGCGVLERRYPLVDSHEAITTKLANKLTPIKTSQSELGLLWECYEGPHEEFLRVLDTDEAIIDEYLATIAPLYNALREAPSAVNEEDQHYIDQLREQARLEAAKASAVIGENQTARNQLTAIHTQAISAVRQIDAAEQEIVAYGNWRGLAEIALLNSQHPRT